MGPTSKDFNKYNIYMRKKTSTSKNILQHFQSIKLNIKITTTVLYG